MGTAIQLAGCDGVWAKIPPITGPVLHSIGIRYKCYKIKSCAPGAFRRELQRHVYGFLSLFLVATFKALPPGKRVTNPVACLD